MLCFAKILQCCFTATLGRSEEEEGTGGGLPSAPSPLTQIVPNSASIYSVFHSVNYNSVAHANPENSCQIIKKIVYKKYRADYYKIKVENTNLCTVQ